MTTPMPTALVTGATRGIGRAIALELGRTHHVLVGGRDTDAAQDLVALLPSAEPYIADLTSGDLPPLPDRLDVLIHSAGIESGTTIENTDIATWRQVFEVNVFAVATLTQHALPSLRAASGLVVSINSGAGFTSGPGSATYSASKFALRALTDALREEERPNGVRVSSVHPGRTDTQMQQQLVASEGDEYDTQYYLSPESVAAAVRLVVDMPPEGTVETLSLRPTRKRS
jgi:NADP-dependent 3-hydroxy acid dehydrogenase YdfG